MQADLSRQRLRMFIERIINKVFAKETGALRMQQIGLFTLIYVLQDDEEPVTASRIAAMMGQSNGQVHRQLQKLLDRKLVKRERVRNRQGRGHHGQSPGVDAVASGSAACGYGDVHDRCQRYDRHAGV